MKYEKDELEKHEKLLTNLIINKITTEDILNYLSLLDDIYYTNAREEKYPEFIDFSRIPELTNNSFRNALVWKLSGEVLNFLKEMCRYQNGYKFSEIQRVFAHIDPELVNRAIQYLADEGKITIDHNSAKYLPSIEDRKKLLIDRITSAGTTLVEKFEAELDSYDRGEDIPF